MKKSDIRTARICSLIVDRVPIRQISKTLNISVGTIYNEISIGISKNWISKEFPENIEIRETISKKGIRKTQTKKIPSKKAVYLRGAGYNAVSELLNIENGEGVQSEILLPIVESQRGHRFQYDITIADFKRADPSKYLDSLAEYWIKDPKKARGVKYYYRRERCLDVGGESATADLLFVFAKKRQFIRVFLPEIWISPDNQTSRQLGDRDQWIKSQIEFIQKRIVSDLGIVLDRIASPVSAPEYALPIRFFDIFDYSGEIVIDFPEQYSVKIDRSLGYSEIESNNRAIARRNADLLFRIPADNEKNIALLGDRLDRIEDLLERVLTANLTMSENIDALVGTIEGSRQKRADMLNSGGINGYA